MVPPVRSRSEAALPDGSTTGAVASGEGALVEAIREGDQRACELLVRTHAGVMRALALRLLGDEPEADDVVQEAFLAAFKALDRFEGRSSIATWLHRITANVALMRIRARKARPVVCIEDLLPDFTSRGAWPEALEPWSEPEEDPLAREELCGRVRETIARLPEKHRIPLLMRDIEGLGNDEIARRLDITVNAAKIRVHRARQAVRTLLEPLMAEISP